MSEHVKFAYILFFCMKMKKSVIARLNAMKSMDKFTLKEILENLVFYRKIFSCIVYCGNVELLYF